MVGGGQRVCQCTTLYIIGVFGVAAGSLKIMYDAQHITLFSWACLDASCYFLLSTGVHLAMPGGFDDMYSKCDCGVVCWCRPAKLPAPVFQMALDRQPVQVQAEV